VLTIATKKKFFKIFRELLNVYKKLDTENTLHDDFMTIASKNYQIQHTDEQPKVEEIDWALLVDGLNKCNGKVPEWILNKNAETLLEVLNELVKYAVNPKGAVKIDEQYVLTIATRKDFVKILDALAARYQEISTFYLNAFDSSFKDTMGKQYETNHINAEETKASLVRPKLTTVKIADYPSIKRSKSQDENWTEVKRAFNNGEFPEQLLNDPELINEAFIMTNSYCTMLSVAHGSDLLKIRISVEQFREIYEYLAYEWSLKHSSSYPGVLVDGIVRKYSLEHKK
jgi:frataxin-like iron-binding protein CyaY